MDEITPILRNFLIKSKSSAAFIVNGKKEVVSSVNLEYPDSIGAMSGAIISMCVKFLEDLNHGKLEQFHLRTSGGMIISNQINYSNFIIVLAPADHNLALLVRSADEVVNLLKTHSLLK